MWLGLQTVSALERWPLFRVFFIERWPLFRVSFTERWPLFRVSFIERWLYCECPYREVPLYCFLSAPQFMPRGTTTPTFVNMGSMPQMGAGTLPVTVSRYVCSYVCTYVHVVCTYICACTYVHTLKGRGTMYASFLYPLPIT